MRSRLSRWIPSLVSARCVGKGVNSLGDAVKGYLRKSHILFAMKEYTKAMQAVQEVSVLD